MHTKLNDDLAFVSKFVHNFSYHPLSISRKWGFREKGEFKVMDMLEVNQFECIIEAVSVLGAFINIVLSYECIPEIEHAYGQLRRD